MENNAVDNGNQAGKFLAKSYFGKKGWFFVFYYFVALAMIALMTGDGLNVLVPFWAERGVMPTTLLNIATIGGVISLGTNLLFAIWVHKKGGKIPAIILFFASGIAYGCLGLCQTIIPFAIVFCLVFIFMNGLCFIALSELTAVWFPRRKGVVMGWTTIGGNFSALALVPLFTFLVSSTGLAIATPVFGVICIVMGILGIFFLYDSPEKAGVYPDNITPEQEKQYGIPSVSDFEAMNAVDKNYKSPWNLKKLMSVKEFWIIAFIIFFMYVGAALFITQSVVRIMEFGFDQGKATLLNAIFSGAVGIIGSYLWGYIDSRTNTKRSMVIYAILQALAYFLNVWAFAQGITWMLMVSMALGGFCLGGTANWPVSIVAEFWGRKDFIQVFTPINTIGTAGRVLSPTVLALLSALTPGSYQLAALVYGCLYLVVMILLLLLNKEKFIAKYPKND